MVAAGHSRAQAPRACGKRGRALCLGPKRSGNQNHFPIPRVPKADPTSQGGDRAGCQRPDLDTVLITAVLTRAVITAHAHFTPWQLRIEPLGALGQGEVRAWPPPAPVSTGALPRGQVELGHAGLRSRVAQASKPTQFHFLLPLVPPGTGRSDLCPNVISSPCLLLSKQTLLLPFLPSPAKTPLKPHIHTFALPAQSRGHSDRAEGGRQHRRGSLFIQPQSRSHFQLGAFWAGPPGSPCPGPVPKGLGWASAGLTYVG